MPTTASSRRSRDATLELLRRYESRNITYQRSDGSWPIVWERASGCDVWDTDGKRYLDLTAAFGVATAGHANRAVVRAGQRQMERLLHAMGDVHPHRLKADLARVLSRLTFERWNRVLPRPKTRSAQTHGKTIFCNSGFEAVEAALKTARLATGRPGVVAFDGAYHGLGYGALNVTHRDHFRLAFRNQLAEFGSFVDYPTTRQALSDLERDLTKLLRQRSRSIGAILVEPVQARGGIRIPPTGFLRLLRRLSSEHGVLLIADEIYTGFGRTGRWFACEHSDTAPDLICLGKALTGGFPLSACVGRADIMDCWPESTGEAIHTSTFLGHPVGCAMALAQIEEITRLKLPERSARLGEQLLQELGVVRSRNSSVRLQVRGLGLLAGVELSERDGRPATQLTLTLIERLLARGFVFLPEGEHANVLAWTPPLTISPTRLRTSVRAVQAELDRMFAEPGGRP